MPDEKVPEVVVKVGQEADGLVTIAADGSVNIASKALADAIAKMRENSDAARFVWPHINIFCPTNWKCNLAAASE